MLNTSHIIITSLELFSLSHVIVLVGVVFVTLHVISVNEGLDPLFQVWRLHWELKLVVEFGKKQIVTECLPHLHNSKGRCFSVRRGLIGALLNCYLTMAASI